MRYAAFAGQPRRHRALQRQRCLYWRLGSRRDPGPSNTTTTIPLVPPAFGGAPSLNPAPSPDPEDGTVSRSEKAPPAPGPSLAGRDGGRPAPKRSSEEAATAPPWGTRDDLDSLPFRCPPTEPGGPDRRAIARGRDLGSG